MTPKAPARLIGYFAPRAPVCVLFRRGPTKFTQMVLWHTDTDVFVPGQWIRGVVHDVTMTSDGKYAAIEIMRDDQHVTVCRPPYFTALEVVESPLCYNGTQIFRDRLYIIDSKVYADNACPLERLTIGPRSISHNGYNYEYLRQEYKRRWVIDARKGAACGRDQRKREVLFKDGKVYDFEGDNLRVLYDSNPSTFESIPAPDWAKQW